MTLENDFTKLRATLLERFHSARRMQNYANIHVTAEELATVLVALQLAAAMKPTAAIAPADDDDSPLLWSPETPRDAVLRDHYARPSTSSGQSDCA